VKQRDREIALRLEEELLLFHHDRQALLGIQNDISRSVFVRQLIDSIHRVQYVSVLQSRDISIRRTNPGDELFDPLKAAIFQQRSGNSEEAFWLIFLFVHFGKHPKSGWQYVRDIYGRLGDGNRWDWENTSANPTGFRAWLAAHAGDLKRPEARGGFGNHRKYESLDAYSSNGTGAVVQSYVMWIDPPRTHQQLIAQTLERAEGNRRKAFDMLYHSMSAVTRFGRLARFDYLTMLGKLRLATIEPGSAYIESATGPLRGARLLFDGNEASNSRAAALDQSLLELDDYLKVGMQVLEDALCNWQKSPIQYERFRG